MRRDATRARSTSRQRVTEKLVTLDYNKEVHDLLQVTRGPSAQVAGP